ncbi:MAG: extracellular solute-binding protein [Chloroflexota bacterium]
MNSVLRKGIPLGTVLALVLAACGGQLSSTSPSASTAASVALETPAPFPSGDVTIELWTKEGDPQIDYVQSLADAYHELHANVTINVVNKDVEALREDMVNTALAPETQPQLLWTVADHLGPFLQAGVVQPIGGKIDPSIYAASAMDAMDEQGQIWGAPISNGNQLMLYYNKDLVGDAAPADTDALVATAKENTGGGKYGLVFNQTESFWLTPWIGGFGGSVFDTDGRTPTLNTPEMQNALKFLYDLKYTDALMPSECDYPCASDLFTGGDAAMIVNGDWELANYKDKLGDKLGVSALPTVSSTGEDPKPYTAGAYYMVPTNDSGDTLTVVLDFITWSTSLDNQKQMVTDLGRLPGLQEALDDSIVTGDPLLSAAAEAVAKGTPQPTNVEMRCVFDALNVAVRAALAGDTGNGDVATLTADAQTATENCIATQAE